VRYVAIAAVAATFWLLLATVRLIVHAPSPPALAARVDYERRLAAVPAHHLPLCEPYGCMSEATRARLAAEGTLNGPGRAALIAGLNAVRPQVHACYEQFYVPGTAMANVVIAPSGRVSSATVTGKFAGTPTGACVEAAVKTARFPPSDGFRTPYPFQLR